MRVDFGKRFAVKDLGNHSAATVVSLALFVACPVDANPDSDYPGFYEIETASEIFYVYVPPRGGTIFLIAALENTDGPSPGRPIAQTIEDRTEVD